MPRRSSNDAPGMRGDRSRTRRGPLREKRGDTRIETIEKQYGVDLRVRGDMRWDTYKERTGVRSLNDLINGQ